MMNPYEVTAPMQAPPVAFALADLAERDKGTFVYRRLNLHWPVEAELEYSGWNFLQRLWINGQLVWKRISWVSFHRRIDFVMPKSVDPEQHHGVIEIDFARALRIRRFLVRLGDRVVYDERIA